MADYYPLIARAVTGLEKSTGEARRALYERARTALVAQLRSVDPALSEADITHERLALEDAIRKVEGEAARRPRQEEPEPEHFEPAAYSPPTPPPEVSVVETPPPPDWEELQRELDGLEPPLPDQTESDEAHEQELGAPARWQAPAFSEPDRDEPLHASDMEVQSEAESQHDVPPPPEPVMPRKRFAERPSSLVDEGLKGFRNVMAETDDLGGASASASKSARETREAFSSLPPASDMERLEPRFPGGDLRQPAQPDFSPPPPRSEPRVSGRPISPPPPLHDDLEDDEPQGRSRSGLVAKIIVGLALIVVLAGSAYAVRTYWSNIAGVFQSAKAPATQAAKEAPQARPKISDRIGGVQQSPTSRSAGAAAAVAQRAVLYEQGNGPQERKQYVGSVIWRNETASPGPGQPSDVAIKADVEIPERHLRMSVTIRRNLDKSLPVSHTIEVLFNTQADFTPGGIADISGVMMEDADPGRGLALAGLQVKVANGFFLVGLSSEEAITKRNIQLLKDRAWMHVRMAYNDGQRALLAIEKGVPGDRAIEEALTAWGQMPPPSTPAPVITPPAQPR
jgi:hypothetical protein